MLQIPDHLIDAMVAHAKEVAPEECCGFLAGTSTRASELIRLRNELASPVAYSADPQSLLAAHRHMRAKGLDLVAIYHSHPGCEARPSRHDLANNYYGDIPHVIVSLIGDTPVVRAFQLSEYGFHEVGWVGPA